MLNITNIFDGNPALIDMDISEVVDLLNTKNIATQTGVYTYKGIVLKYGEDFTRNVIGKLKAASAADPLLDASYLSLCTNGLDFSNSVVQGTIDALVTAEVFTSEEGVSLKALGNNPISRIEELFGIGTTLTEDDVTATLSEMNKRKLIAKITNRYNSLRGRIDNGEVTTLEQAIEAFGN